MISVDIDFEKYGVTRDDLQSLQDRGIDPDRVAKQLLYLTSDRQYPEVVRPALKENDGFVRDISLDEFTKSIATFDLEKNNRKSGFIIPAAGAASRQFQLLKTIHNSFPDLESIDQIKFKVEFYIKFCEQTEKKPDDYKLVKEVNDSIDEFWKGITEKKYAFCDALDTAMLIDSAEGISGTGGLEECIQNGDIKKVAEYVLTEKGLNYQNTPKALLEFHHYQINGERVSRTPLEEHLINAARIYEGADNCDLHFMVSPEHQEEFESRVDLIKASENFKAAISEFGFTSDQINVTTSTQSRSTNAVSLDLNTGECVRDEDGQIADRVAGHGTLIKNLDALGFDSGYINNIDNIVYDSPVITKLNVLTRKLMMGMLWSLEKKRNELLNYLNGDVSTYATKELTFVNRPSSDFTPEEELFSLVQDELYSQFRVKIYPPEGRSINQNDIETLKEILDRPIVVAGYVPLEPGQNGGGPFVLEKEINGVKVQSVNTVEGAEFEGGQENEHFLNGKFFNPVAVAYSKLKADGTFYTPSDFVDPSRSFITEKTDSNGNPIKVYEDPGFWNGAMANVLQCSIALPKNVFAAVKNLLDMLQELHQPNEIQDALTELDKALEVFNPEVSKYINSMIA